MNPIFLFLFLVGLPCKIFAGTLYEITITKKGEDEIHEVHIGVLFSGTEIVAYSPKLGKFVSIFTKHDVDPPRPVIEYWNPALGRQVSLYKFEESNEVLMAINSPSKDLKALPDVQKIGVKAIADAD